MARIILKVHLPWIILMIIISIQSSISSIDVPQLGITFMDKILHFIVFGALGLLIIRGMMLSNIKKGFFWTLLIGSAFAILDEWHQLYVPGRDSSIYDFVADLLGILCFSLAYYWYQLRKRRRAVFMKGVTEQSVS